LLGAREVFSPTPPGGSARTVVAKNKPTPIGTKTSRPKRAFVVSLPFLVPSLACGANVLKVAPARRDSA
jgi:hypothetical protein